MLTLIVTLRWVVSDEYVRISQITMLCFCGCSVGKFPAAVWEEVIADSLTHHDACLRPLTHTLCLWLPSPRCMLTLAVSLTCDCTRYYACPRAVTHFTCACTQPPLCFPSPPHSPTHSVVLTLTNMFARTLSPNHSVCNCTYGRSHLLAITHTIMFALALSLTHSMHTYDYTHHPVCLPSTSHSHTLLVITSSYIHHHTCVHHQEWETGWSGKDVVVRE